MDVADRKCLAVLKGKWDKCLVDSQGDVGKPFLAQEIPWTEGSPRPGG